MLENPSKKPEPSSAKGLHKRHHLVTSDAMGVATHSRVIDTLRLAQHRLLADLAAWAVVDDLVDLALHLATN